MVSTLQNAHTAVRAAYPQEQIGVFVPSIQRTGTPIAADVRARLIECAERTLCRIAGGCSRHSVFGCWEDETGAIIRESSEHVYALVNKAPGSKELEKVYTLAAELLFLGNQTAVGIIFDGRYRNVSRNDVASYLCQSERGLNEGDLATFEPAYPHVEGAYSLR